MSSGDAMQAAAPLYVSKINPTFRQIMRNVIPVMTPDMHKGQCGRIGIVGGSKEYTGAPYFAAIAALKSGADLVHVFTTSEAATPIKSYHPDLIVHPFLDDKDYHELFRGWMPRLHAVVLGPGLSRNVGVSPAVDFVIHECKRLDLPLIVDADGLHYVTENLTLISGYANTILTPNVVEFERLYKKTLQSSPSLETLEDKIRETAVLSKVLGCVVLLKNAQDIVTNGQTTVVNDQEGCLRRCGGQGDLAAGSLGTFSFWVLQLLRRLEPPPAEKNGDRSRSTSESGTAAAHPCAGNPECDKLFSPFNQNDNKLVVAGVMASMLTRHCAAKAFAEHGRSMCTNDMISYIADFMKHFD